jgi:hypothetical protein
LPVFRTASNSITIHHTHITKAMYV